MTQAKPAENATGLSTSLWDWKGLRVEKILFEGVTFDATDTLPKELPQKVDTERYEAQPNSQIRDGI